MKRKSSKLPKLPKFYTRKAMAELDQIWAYNVKSRDHFMCKLCGKKERLNSHHIISRVHLSIRWDVRNGITLCEHCHLMKVHRDTVRYALVLIEMIGVEVYSELETLSKQLINFNLIYYENKKEELKGNVIKVESSMLPRFTRKQTGDFVW